MKLLSIGAAAVPTMLVMAALLAPAPLPADDALLKCGRRAQVEPHYVLDGVFVAGPEAPDGAVMPELDRADIARIEVLCWDPVRRVLQRGTGENVVHVTTKTFMASVHEDLRRVVAAQDEFRAGHGRFAGDLTELELKPATAGIDITMSRSETGWHATAGGDLLTISCHVFAGAVTPPAESLVQREPSCATLPQLTR